MITFEEFADAYVAAVPKILAKIVTRSTKTSRCLSGGTRRTT